MSELRQRRPRVAEPKYLAWLRKQGCACGCGSAPPSDAAHLRAGSIKHGKDLTGMGIKPDDRWALPLRHDHHMAQHACKSGEVLWWKSRGIDPFERELRYHAAYFAQAFLDDHGKPAERPARKRARKARPKPKRHERAPAPQRKIASRGFPKVKRKFR